MNYSLRTLMIVAAGFAIVLASLVYPTRIVGDIFYTVGVLAIAFAIIAALYCRGTRRAYWIGFLILFAVYFCHTVWPSEIRSALIYYQSSEAPGYAPQVLVPTRLFTYAYGALHPEWRRVGTTGSSYYSRAGIETIGELVSFMTIGNTTIALVVGFCGGIVGRAIAVGAFRPGEEVTKEI